ncbi:MAG: NUDIX domain-containing protein [Rikenellaceae bacterium]
MEIKIFFNNKFIISSSSEYKYNKNLFNIVEKKSEVLTSPQKVIELFQSFDIIKVTDIDSQSLVEMMKRIFVPIYADGGVVKNSRGDRLMIYRNGFWDLPKGKREEGEDSKECAVREVEEECGVIVESVAEKICTTFHLYELRGKWIIKETAWYEMVCKDDSTLTPQVEEGITEIKWIEVEIIESYYPLSYATIVDVLKSV